MKKRILKGLGLGLVMVFLFGFEVIRAEGDSEKHIIILNSPRIIDYPDFSMEDEFGIIEHRYQSKYPNKDLGDSFINDLKKYQMLYLGQWAAEDTRGIFYHSEYKKAITEFLSRGGVLFADYLGVSAYRAKKYFPTIGVLYPGNLKGEGAYYNTKPNAKYREHPLLTRPNKIKGSIGACRWWENWSEEQIPLFVSESDPSHAAMIVQENVLGKGTVIFCQIPHFFRKKGKRGRKILANILSYVYGEDIYKYKKKKLEEKGGPGETM